MITENPVLSPSLERQGVSPAVITTSDGGHFNLETRSDKSTRAKYLKENRLRFKAAAAKRYVANREANTQRSREYQRNHKEQTSATKKEYYKRNSLRIRARQSAYAKKNVEANRKYQADYHKRYPEKRRLKQIKRKALKLGAVIGDGGLIKQWERSWRRKLRARCYWCSGVFAVKNCHSDHIIALNKGGPHSVENLAISCAGCNLSKGDMLIAEWNNKLKQRVLL